jgi:hypothetical protein
MMPALWCAALALTLVALAALGSAIRRGDRRGTSTMLLAVVVGALLTLAMAPAVAATW